MRRLRTSLQGRMVAVVLLSVAPLLLIAAIETRRAERRELDSARQLAVAAALNAAGEQSRRLESARQLLIALTGVPSVAGMAADCSARLAAIRSVQPVYANLGIVRGDGSVACSALPVDAVQVQEHSYIQAALRTDGFALGEFEIAGLMGIPSLGVAYPIRDERGAPVAVIFAAVQAGMPGSRELAARLPDGTTLLIVDPSGVILADSAGPQRVGRLITGSGLWPVAGDITEGGTAVAEDLEGRSSLVATARFGDSQGRPSGFAFVAIPRDAVVREARSVLWQYAALIGSVTLLGLLLTRFTSTRFISRPLQQLLEVVERVRKGDLNARLSTPRPPGELGILGDALEEMSEALLTARTSLEHRAYRDGVTGLPNRAGLLEQIGPRAAQLAPGESLVLVMVDLTDFDATTITFGERAGEVILQQIATRLAALADGGTAARLERSMLAVAAVAVTRADAEHLAARIRTAVAEPLFFAGTPLVIEAACGSASWPADAVEPESLLRCAEVALRSERARVEGYAAFQRDDEALVTSNVHLLYELRRALDRGAFEMHYQPVIDLQSRAVVHFEALLRWTNEQGQQISPGLFIPIAERSGFIHSLELWVLGRAVRDAAAWRRQGVDVPVSVNVSARSISHPACVDAIAGTLGQQLPPSRLIVEITETALMPAAHRAAENCVRLRKLGVSVAIDDFGAGYSSLDYVRRFHADEVKIDRSLTLGVVDASRDRLLVNSVIELGQRLGIAVVAEGIEDETVLRELIAMNCPGGQGFLFAQPLPASELGPWLDRVAPHGGAHYPGLHPTR